MNARPLLTATLLLATLVPLVPGADAWRCVPAEDVDATRVTINGGTYYMRRYGLVTASVWELWQETNGEKGLQLSSGMSCVGAPDRLVESRCFGFCPIVL